MKRRTEPSPHRRGGIPAFTKRDLILYVARNAELTQDQARTAVQTMLDGIINTLLDGRVLEFRDFGVFEPVLRKSRVGRNPKSPEQTVKIPDHKSVKFRIGRRFKDRLDAYQTVSTQTPPKSADKKKKK